MTMTEIEAALPGTVFMRTHKSFIINLTEIRSIEGNTIGLSENRIFQSAHLTVRH
ncbi:LytTR family transcriptional regulator DNA-binding domain-containing protein [Mucilaginibacter sp. L3T2-6]|uniref:LytTR family transcriptional regulator DNA-binding domain-containing protein n=1 Tax=Mucilaginibacter sp. L3T2-6 TaxID=3062491 RepID=UPI0026753D38|nr:LytTR family transcriptional regulator DNA-binding domain-containing protein [Mucilaginibacter sp. L3T2-6]MDO3643752.1 LytTR family transcriptional regulator DNA-binding domain-containing protein [Mucilaginibacter sp. L3T2-6]MDV6216203.1 LytTR family transcriptional regulator DNA-binding domain-containing protein [Mucilaginibacter sp. L3T2-6]